MKLSNNRKYKSINNCFLNSSLECLIHCNYLRMKLHSIQDRKLNDKPLAKEFKKLITIIYEGKYIYDYYNIKEILSEIEEKYKRNQQNDTNAISITKNETISGPVKIIFFAISFPKPLISIIITFILINLELFQIYMLIFV